MALTSKLKRSTKLFLQIFGFIAIVLTVFPLIPVDHWSIRVFDFPHLQLTILTFLALVAYFLKFDVKKRKDYIFVGALFLCFLFQASKIFPYTTMAGYEVGNATKTTSPNERPETLSVYTANVLQKNKESELVIQDAQSFDADVLLFTETNSEWVNALTKSLGKEYVNTIRVPLENTYGMLMLSKFPLSDEKVRYMVEDTIPSIHVKVALPSGKKVQLYAIHPAPPTPQHNPSSVDRDAELIKIAQLVRASNYPVVVMGDFNDVAWSESTTLFQKFSGLLDLRKGRGLFNSYNAKSWIMRWPLDHVFTSPDFRVVAVDLGADVGSDHFPFYAKLSLEPEKADEQKLPPPSEQVKKRALNQIENEQEDDGSK